MYLSFACNRIVTEFSHQQKYISNRKTKSFSDMLLQYISYIWKGNCTCSIDHNGCFTIIFSNIYGNTLTSGNNGENETVQKAKESF